MNKNKQINARMTVLKKKAGNRRRALNGKVHPAKADNEFFPSIRDSIYEQIVKEKV